jgi:hypothetical protein
LGLALAIVFWLAIAALLILLAVFLTGRRSARWRSIAARGGFEYRASAMPFQGTDISGLTLLESDNDVVVSNLLQGMVRGCYAFLFDLPSCNPSSEQVSTTTVAGFRYPHGRLPILQIAPKQLFDRVEEALALKPCLEIDSEFSKHFLVNCESERDARAFLTPEKLRQLRLQLDNFRIESSPDWLLVYRPGASIKPEKLAEFANAAATIACVLLPPPRAEVPLSA